MKGDRCVCGDGYFWNKSDGGKVTVYMPKLDANNQWIITPEQTVLVESVGAVLVGSTGEIDGNLIKVSLNNLKGQGDAKPIGNESVDLVPVNLDDYKRVGYFPVNCIRILPS